MYTSQIIALLLTPTMIYLKIFGQFLPHLSQIFNENRFFRNYCYWFQFFKKLIKHASLATSGKIK